MLRIRRNGRARTGRVRRGALVATTVAAALAMLVGIGGQRATAAVAPDSTYVSGGLAAAGGPFLTDRFGRVVFLHGVNAVDKRAPFELYPDTGKPWDFSAADAGAMARLGFDVVRLGILWQGLEPGTLGPNSASVCSPGPPGNPHQYDAARLDAYLSNLTRTVDLLGRYHIYTVLDMHQDVYSQLFTGEGAPPWAVCTSGLPVTIVPGRWSRNYAGAAADAAFSHFWYNDVVGNLQGEYDRVWSAVAAHFSRNPWILGYDLYNEPFSRTLQRFQGAEIDRLLECFYTGRADPGLLPGSARRLACPPGDPAEGLIPAIRHADPRHLIFYEPDIFSAHGRPNYVGPMDYPGLVLAFHDYCSYRSGVTGDPTDLTACSNQELAAMRRRQHEMAGLTTPAQPGGPAWFMGEFGATDNPALLGQLTADANQLLVGWTYWQWRYYQDPTGSSDEAVVNDDGTLKANAAVLAQPYPQAVAGIPTTFSYDAASGRFRLLYVPNPKVRAPTVVSYPSVISGRWGGYCATVRGGTIVSRPGAPRILVTNGAGASGVGLDVSGGRCAPRPAVRGRTAHRATARSGRVSAPRAGPRSGTG